MTMGKTDLRLQRDDLAVFLDPDRRAVHAGFFARDLGGASFEGASYNHFAVK